MTDNNHSTDTKAEEIREATEMPGKIRLTDAEWEEINAGEIKGELLKRIHDLVDSEQLHYSDLDALYHEMTYRNNHWAENKSAYELRQYIKPERQRRGEEGCLLMMRSMIAGSQPTGADVGLPVDLVPVPRSVLQELVNGADGVGGEERYGDVFHDAAYELVERFKLVLESEEAASAAA